MELDIQQYKKRLIDAQERVKKADISEKNKDLILGYDRVMGLERLTEGSRAKTLYALLRVAKMVNRELPEMKREDVEDLVLRLDSDPKLTIWSRIKIKQMFRKFFKWVRYGKDYNIREGYPEEVSWFKAYMKKKDMPLINPADLLTEEDIKKLIDTADNPRDKALVVSRILWKLAPPVFLT